jgi:hypothetical protein
VWLAALAALCLCACKKSPEQELRKRLAAQTSGTINLPPGLVEVSAELQLAPGAHDLEIVGSGTLLKADDEFKGRAVVVAEGARNIRLRDFTIDGNRIVLEKPVSPPAAENPLRDHYLNNGVLLVHVDGAEISNLTMANIANLAILASRSSKVRIHHLRVEDCGSLDAKGHSNGTGGVALEDGTTGFEVRSSTFRRLRGNGLWTRSGSDAPRQDNGLFIANRFDAIGRDAILVWNANSVRVEENTGARIGFPNEAVDPLAQPAAIAVFGNVDRSTLAGNKFEEVNGKCIDLDGFHDGVVMRNECVNRRLPQEYPFGHFGIVMNNTDPKGQPANVEITGNKIDGMKYGGLFLIGSGHRVIGNRFEHLNTAECPEGGGKFGCVYLKDEPKMLESGIYLGRGGAHPAPARGNTIRNNKVSGHNMKSRCIVAAPGVSLGANNLTANECSDFSLAR